MGHAKKICPSGSVNDWTKEPSAPSGWEKLQRAKALNAKKAMGLVQTP